MKFTKACIIPGILELLLCLNGCYQDPEIENNEPDDPRVELEVVSRISAELSITSSDSSSDITYGADIIRIVNGEESNEVISFQTRELDEEHRYSWWTEGLQPNNTYVARSFITNGRNRKYSEKKTFTTPSTSKPSVSIVTMEGGHLVAKVLDNGGRSIVDVGFVAGDTPDRKSLLRKEKVPALEYVNNCFSLPLNSLESGKIYYVLAYAIDNQEDVGYGLTPIEVNIPQGVESISLDKEELSLEPGGTFTLTATVKPDNALDKTVVWTSSDKRVATVTDGVISAIEVGSVAIVASAGICRDTCFVNVISSDVPVTNVILSESGKEVYISEIISLIATVEPEEATDKSLMWESSNPEVATVIQDGLIRACGKGECLITATAASGQSASFICTVVSEAPIIPDPVFRDYIYTHFDIDQDGLLSREEVLKIEYIQFLNKDITSLSGIEYFDNLYHLLCSDTNIKELDLSYNKRLETLNCSSTQLSSLNLSDCLCLSELYCSFNASLSSLDVSKCTQLKKLFCQQTSLSSLDISRCSQLEELRVSNTKITDINLLNCHLLKELYCDYSEISSLDFSNCPQIQKIDCCGTPMVSLNLSGCSKLRYLHCGDSNLSSLNLSNCVSLQELDCQRTNLSSLNESTFPQLQLLNLSSTSFMELNLTRCPQLQILSLSYTPITVLNLSNCSLLKALHCEYSNLSSLDVSDCPKLQSLFCHHTAIGRLNVSACPLLDELGCDNTDIAELDVSNCGKLSYFNCTNTKLTSLNVSLCNQLSFLHCSGTYLSSLDVSGCINLSYLSCGTINDITQLDLRNNINLRGLTCTNCPKLSEIWLISGRNYEYLEYDSIATIYYD